MCNYSSSKEMALSISYDCLETKSVKYKNRQPSNNYRRREPKSWGLHLPLMITSKQFRILPKRNNIAVYHGLLLPSEIENVEEIQTQDIGYLLQRLGDVLEKPQWLSQKREIEIKINIDSNAKSGMVLMYKLSVSKSW